LIGRWSNTLLVSLTYQIKEKKLRQKTSNSNQRKVLIA